MKELALYCRVKHLKHLPTRLPLQLAAVLQHHAQKAGQHELGGARIVVQCNPAPVSSRTFSPAALVKRLQEMLPTAPHRRKRELPRVSTPRHPRLVHALCRAQMPG